MKYCVHLLLIFGLFSYTKTISQIPKIEWQHSYGGPNGDYSTSLQPTKDGGYIVAGYTDENGGDVVGYHGNANIGDLWIIKLDTAGTIQWKRTLGGDYTEPNAASIRETGDGGYIIAATSASRNCEIAGNHGGTDIWVVKLDGQGAVTWNKSYGGSQTEYGMDIAIVPGNGYIISGSSESSDGDVTKNNGTRDAWVIKITDTGILEWQKNFGGSSDDEFYSVNISTDGNYILSGYTFSNDADAASSHGERDYFVVKLKKDGSTVWKKTLGGSFADIANSSTTTPDGGCIIVGLSASNDGDVSGNHQSLGQFSDFWTVKLNSNGGIDWQKCYGGVYNEIAHAIELSADGGYVIAGSSESSDGDVRCNAGLTDSWVIKIDNTGKLVWQKNFGGRVYDEVRCVLPLTDGSVLTSGYTCSTEINGFHPSNNNGTCADYWIVKLSSPDLGEHMPSVRIDNSAAICNGRATLKAIARYAGTKYVFQWTRNGIAVGANSAEYKAADFKNGDVVVCTLTSGGQCEDVASTTVSDMFVLKNNPDNIQPQLTITADNTTICNCSLVTFKSSVSNGGFKPQYQWLVNDVNTGITGDIFVTNTINAGDVVKYIYTDGKACMDNEFKTSNTIQINGGGTVATSVAISSSLSTICLGMPVSFKATPVNAGSQPSFQWKLNGKNTGTNSAIYLDSSFKDNDVITCDMTADPAYNCSSQSTVSSNPITLKVSAKVAPDIRITSSSDTICSGTIVTFTANYSNAGQSPLFKWMVNGVSSGTNNKIFTTASLINNDVISCEITADPIYTCATPANALSNTVTVKINQGTNPTIVINSSANNICYGDPVTFTAIVKDGGTSYGLQWKVNNVVAANGTDSYITSALNNGDSVTCMLIPGPDNCQNTAVMSNTVHMQINTLPVVTIMPQDTFISSGSSIKLNANVLGSITSFTWQPASMLQNSALLSPVTVPLTNDERFYLSVTSDKGCTVQQKTDVRIKYAFNMPNAFTPNGDGINDIFRVPASLALTLKEFAIYDRWGNKIFVTSDINNGWDGTANKTKLSPDVFIYTIKGSDERGSVTEKGTVLLIR